MPLPKTSDEPGDVDEAPAAPAPAPGQVHRYPVTQPNGKVRHQLILVVSEPDPQTGAVRGVPLAYEDEAAVIHPDQFAAGPAES
jgi:hypothetical protein